MKPVDQTIFKKDLGDCARACIASIFDCPIEDVPNFWEQTQDADTFWRLNNEWLSEKKGFRLVPIAIETGSEHILGGVLCIAIGRTGRGSEDHAVVWRDGIVHDPNPSRTGLVGDPDVFVLIVPVNHDEAFWFSGLLEAAVKTLRDNRHLTDGDECTLRELRDVVFKIKPDWEA